VTGTKSSGVVWATFHLQIKTTNKDEHFEMAGLLRVDGTHVAPTTSAATSRKVQRGMGGKEMLTLTRKLCATTLGLMLLLVAASSANAQSFGGRLSNGEKVGAIGGGAAAGAVIGGLLGGTKGAIIGGALGAVGGTAYVATQGRDDYRYGRYYSNRSYSNGSRWEERRFDNYRWDRDRNWDHDRDHDRDDHIRDRSSFNRFRR
jgi:hypothetical protein